MRKKALRISVAAALIASMMSVPAYAESAVVTGNGVNMRSGPGTNYRVIDSLPRGATVNVSDRSNGSWYAVDYNGSSGFMSASYLSITEEDYSGVTTPSGEGNALQLPALGVARYMRIDFVPVLAGQRYKCADILKLLCVRVLTVQLVLRGKRVVMPALKEAFKQLLRSFSRGGSRKAELYRYLAGS